MLGFNNKKKLTKKDLSGTLPDSFSLREDWFTIEGLGQVLLREMNAAQRDDWEWMMVNRTMVSLSEEQQVVLGYELDKIGDPRGVCEFLISQCLIDPSTGKAMLEKDDADVINNLPIRVRDPLYNACLVICGLRETDFDDAKKNSAEATASVSSSGLPADGGKPLPS